MQVKLQNPFRFGTTKGEWLGKWHRTRLSELNLTLATPIEILLKNKVTTVT
jgi:hypothetical protein